LIPPIIAIVGPLRTSIYWGKGLSRSIFVIDAVMLHYFPLVPCFVPTPQPLHTPFGTYLDRIFCCRVCS